MSRVDVLEDAPWAPCGSIRNALASSLPEHLAGARRRSLERLAGARRQRAGVPSGGECPGLGGVCQSAVAIVDPCNRLGRIPRRDPVRLRSVRFRLCSGRPDSGLLSRGQRPRRDHAGAALTFESLGLSADLLRTVAEEGYHTPTPVQDGCHPAGPPGARSAGRCPDRDWQDRRIRAPDPRSDAPACEHQLLARPSSGPGPDPGSRHANLRCRWMPASRPTVAPSRCARPWSTAVSRSSPRSRRFGAASRSSWPRPDACWTTLVSGRSTLGWSRSWCSTKPIECSTWASCRTSAKILELLPAAARTCSSQPPSPTISGACRARS